MKRVFVALLLATGTLLAPTAAVAGGGSTAVPAGTEEFEGTCSATFVRSSSGIINETNRECEGAQNPWTDADVWIQFRPLDGKPRQVCDADAGLVREGFIWREYNYALNYFELGAPYLTCIYLVDPEVAAGTVDSTSATATSVDLPSGLPGRYRIDVDGTWTNGGHGNVDAEFVEQGMSTNDWQQGWPPLSLGDAFGDLLVEGSDIVWSGTYTGSHAYSHVGSFANSIDLLIFDGYGNTLTAVPGWYGDNSGSLTYTVTYLGP